MCVAFAIQIISRDTGPRPHHGGFSPARAILTEVKRVRAKGTRLGKMVEPRRLPKQRGLRILDCAWDRVTDTSSNDGRTGACGLITGGDFCLVSGRQTRKPGNKSIAPHTTPVATGRPAAGSRPSSARRGNPHTHDGPARDPSFDKVDDDATSDVELTPQPYFKGQDPETLPFPRGAEPAGSRKYFEAHLASTTLGRSTGISKVGLQTTPSAHGAQRRLRRPKGPPRP